MTNKGILFFLALALWLSPSAKNPTSTTYSPTECEGSSMPYPTPAKESLAYPDTLTPVFINHVGRHGARYMSSAKFTTSLLKHLRVADSLGCITPAGKKLQRLCLTVEQKTGDMWGALDSIGMAEQRQIATRAYKAFKPLFHGCKISAISSYVPRCVASMDEFTHQLSRLTPDIEIYTSSGKQNSSLMRPWEDDREYIEFMNGDTWKKVYDEYLDAALPKNVAYKLLGEKYPFHGNEAKDFTLNVYKLVSGCAAIGIDSSRDEFLTLDEYNALWSIENMHHYLTHSASTISSVPAHLANKLLMDIISTTRDAVNGNIPYTVRLRFGHAETLMPLLSLIHLPGCYYLTNYFDTVGLHWRDFYIVPMGANIQLILFKSATGKYYLRVDLNENPVTLIPGRDIIYTPWELAEKYLTRCALD